VPACACVRTCACVRACVCVYVGAFASVRVCVVRACVWFVCVCVRVGVGVGRGHPAYFGRPKHPSGPDCRLEAIESTPETSDRRGAPGAGHLIPTNGGPGVGGVLPPRAALERKGATGTGARGARAALRPGARGHVGSHSTPH